MFPEFAVFALPAEIEAADHVSNMLRLELATHYLDHWLLGDGGSERFFTVPEGCFDCTAGHIIFEEDLKLLA